MQDLLVEISGTRQRPLLPGGAVLLGFDQAERPYEHDTEADDAHEHAPDYGHTAVPHVDYVDYVHVERRHTAHEGHTTTSTDGN